MKSDQNTSWSEEDVDELLTSFFQAEVPGRLSGPMPASMLAPSSPAPAPAVDMIKPRPRTVFRRRSFALFGSAAVVALAATLSTQFGPWWSSSETPDNSAVTATPLDEDDEPINVNAREIDDFNAPEQDIEILDNPGVDQGSKKKTPPKPPQ